MVWNIKRRLWIANTAEFTKLFGARKRNKLNWRKFRNGLGLLHGRDKAPAANDDPIPARWRVEAQAPHEIRGLSLQVTKSASATELPQSSRAKRKPVHHVHERGSAQSPRVPRQSACMAIRGNCLVTKSWQASTSRNATLPVFPRTSGAYSVGGSAWSISEGAPETTANVMMTTTVLAPMTWTRQPRWQAPWSKRTLM